MPPKKTEAPAVAQGASRFGRVRNNLRQGLVGLPNVGKSSLFNLLTKQSAAAENFPFCTIDPAEARCPVPDERYDHLISIWKPTSEYPAYLYVNDIAGLIKGASEGAGLGNAFLSHIQAVDGYYHVVRAFDNDEIVHVDDSVDPVRDLETIQNELCLKDLSALESALAAEAKDVKKSQGKKVSELFTQTTDKCRSLLEMNKPIRDAEWTSPEIELIKDKLHTLITTKPCIYLVNLSERDFIRKKNKWLKKIHDWISAHGGGPLVPISVEYEEKLWDLRDDADGLKEATEEAKSALPKAITLGYKQLNLQYFFTAGVKEVRCWTIYKGALAPQAAGVIHGDFERGFIKAEVVGYDDFKALNTGQKGMAEVKAAGKYRLEGKSYVVNDGDIINFQFNVTAKGKK